jgi:hypothetical protein
MGNPSSAVPLRRALFKRGRHAFSKILGHIVSTPPSDLGGVVGSGEGLRFIVLVV